MRSRRALDFYSGLGRLARFLAWLSCEPLAPGSFFEGAKCTNR